LKLRSLTVNKEILLKLLTGQISFAKTLMLPKDAKIVSATSLDMHHLEFLIESNEFEDICLLKNIPKVKRECKV